MLGYSELSSLPGRVPDRAPGLSGHVGGLSRVICERDNAALPEATRLLIAKADGSVLVHAGAGGYKPLN